MKEQICLNHSEWEVMECLWEENPRTVMQIVKVMKERLGWSKSTTATMVRRMEQKGYIGYREGGKARSYFPLLGRDEVVAAEARNLLKRAFGGQVGLLVNALVPENRLSKEDIEELERILHKAGGEEDE